MKSQTLPTPQELLRLMDRELARDYEVAAEPEPDVEAPAKRSTFCCKRCGHSFKAAVDLYFDCPQCSKAGEIL